MDHRINYALFFLLMGGYSCKKDAPLTPQITVSESKFIAHKGGGATIFQENTLEACVNGFNMLDGIEIDLQISRSGTIWLYHDEYFDECDVNGLGRIPAYTDEEIRQHIACVGGNYHLSTLEEVFDYHRKNKLSKKISLDVKSWLPTRYSDTPSYLKGLADEIIRLTTKYDMGKFLFAECEASIFLDRINRSNTGIECYLTSFGDFKTAMRRALTANYAGLSFKYSQDNPITKSEIDELHSKGLKMQLWTLNSEEEILFGKSTLVDYIQTDNMDAQ